MKRIVYLDILKGFAMMSIVLFHIVWEVPSLKLVRPSLFYMWHVPLFFLLSGFFIKEEKLTSVGGFCKSKFKGLYVKGSYYFIPAVLLHNVFVFFNWLINNVDWMSY